MSVALTTAAVFNAPLSMDDWWQSVRWRLARETGWSLEYIEELPLDDIRNFLAVLEAEKEVREWDDD